VNQISSAGKWFDDPILPGIIRWHNGSTFTGLAGKSSEIFYFIQTMKGNLGVTEPFTDPNETLLEPTTTDVEILNKKLIELQGRFPGPDEFRALWTVPTTSELEPGWKELDDYPEHYVYWYGEARSEFFRKEHVVAADFMLPGKVAAYVATIPTDAISETSATTHEPEPEYAGSVSSAPAPDNRDMTGWRVDPEDSRVLIFWDGDVWAQRKPIKIFISEIMESLNISMPPAWNIEHSHSRRDLAILYVLLEMEKGQAWVRDPESDFYDLKVRWWDGGQYTDAVGADQAGWYDAPNDSTKLQWWSGLTWTDQFLDKEQVQIEAERREQARAAKKSFALKVLASAVDGYLGGSTASERQATKDAQLRADRREYDKGWEDRRKAKQDEAIYQQTKYYRRANERRR
jgi:hypothetical protein